MNPLTLREYEQISAYLDGQLSPAETRKLEEQIKTQPDWRSALEELSATRKLLRNAPRFRAPHNFTLTPEMARQHARKSWFPRIATFRFSAALATLATVAALALQFLPGASRLAQVAMAPAMQAPQAEMQSEMFLEASPDSADEPALKAMEPALEATMPPVIYWGSGGGSGGGDSSVDAARGLGGGAAEMPAASGFDPQEGIVTYGGEPPPGLTGSGNAISPSVGMAAGAAEAQPETAPPAELAEAAPFEGENLILGLPSDEEAGEIFRQSAPADGSPAAAEAARVSQPTGAVSFWTPTRIAQAGLVALALLAGVAAWLSRRKG